MSAENYDEERALTQYISRYARHFMTDFEKECLRLASLREKADAADSKGVADKLRARYEAESSKEIDRALANGTRDFLMGVYRRIRNYHDSDALKVNRCPACMRVVRTPLAQQCLWCGHDWHQK